MMVPIILCSVVALGLWSFFIFAMGEISGRHAMAVELNKKLVCNFWVGVKGEKYLVPSTYDHITTEPTEFVKV